VSGRRELTLTNLKNTVDWLASEAVEAQMEASSGAGAISGNRLCLDFANLPYTSGDPAPHQTSWLELIDFLAEKSVISGGRIEELRSLTEHDPRAAGTLLKQAERLGDAMRSAFSAMLTSEDIRDKWAAPINEILAITEGHDELQPHNPGGWKLGFRARHEGLEWLLAAIARSGAELIAEGAKSGLQQCSNRRCRLLFYDDSRTHRRRWCSMALCGNRSKVAAFARRHGGEKVLAHHA
jgi:predicted RNA-binding Zn ribbon-like protein